VPRGVAIPEPRERLFDAAETLLLREGPSALTTRAITAQAGCALGVLHKHFTDLDGFLAEFLLTRFRTALHEVARLADQAGQATVRDNLTAALAALFASPVLAAHDILTTRPNLAARLGNDHGHHAPDLGDLERIVGGYLDAERRLGRIRADVDTGSVAVALIGTAHHLLAARRLAPEDARATMAGVLDTLLAATMPAAGT
jgi:AcrR family transcriptional regulator